MLDTREWKEHKYTAKVKTKTGNIRYIYGDKKRYKDVVENIAKDSIEKLGKDTIEKLLDNPLIKMM